MATDRIAALANVREVAAVCGVELLMLMLIGSIRMFCGSWACSLSAVVQPSALPR